MLLLRSSGAEVTALTARGRSYLKLRFKIVCKNVLFLEDVLVFLCIIVIGEHIRENFMDHSVKNRIMV